MIQFPANTLGRPPDESARRVATRLLEAAGAALERVSDPGDEEALHDFRVNLRRLSSTLMAYRPWLQARAADRAVARIRELAGRTNRARDYEVQIEWLAERRGALRPSQRDALARLLRELEADKARAYAGVLEGIPEGFSELRASLLPKLEAYRAWIRVDEESDAPTFAQVSGELVAEHAQRLQRALAPVRSPGDRARAHEARVQAKRLRYLIEPLARHVEGGKQALRQLKDLQDLLGEFNDLSLLEGSLASSLERAEIERAHGLFDAARSGDAALLRRVRRRTGESGLLALVGLVEERRRELFADLAAKWLGAHGAPQWVGLEAVGQRLGSRKRASVEIERKYLLRALPEAARAGDAIEIEQGWLPGGQVRERLRRVRSAEGERFLRTLKLGSGLKRSEFEEPMESELFERLWPLTAGGRVRKRRYRVREGAHLWEIDVFLDRSLVLAEVELSSEDEEVALPEWLVGYVEREVTGDPDYSNVNLAR
jgi:CHAD domain-containing protein/CYTH domain-containing protein